MPSELVTTINHEVEIKTLFDPIEAKWQTWVRRKRSNFVRLLERHESLDEAHSAHQRISDQYAKMEREIISTIIEATQGENNGRG